MQTPEHPSQDSFLSPVARAFSDAWLQVNTHPGPFVLTWLCFSVAPTLLIQLLEQTAGSEGGVGGTLIVSLISTALGAVCMGALVQATRSGSVVTFADIVRGGMRRFTGFLLTLFGVIFRVLWPPMLGALAVSLVMMALGQSIENVPMETLMLISGIVVFPLAIWGYLRYLLAPYHFLVNGRPGRPALQSSLELFRRRKLSVATLLFLGSFLPAILLLAIAFLVPQLWITVLATSAVSVYELFSITAYVNYCTESLGMSPDSSTSDS